MSKSAFSTHTTISEIDAHAWDSVLPRLGETGYHPFTDTRFLAALEESGSVGPGTGWQAAHLALEDGGGFAPLYLKDHSQGEYVFDHGWAEAAHRAGLSYYPKLQCAVPFTPATGPRLLGRTKADKAALARAMKQFCADHDFSGVHVTFLQKEDAEILRAQGFLLRTDIQYHFHNPGYADFDNFLAALAQKKRKNIRAERRKAQTSVTIRRLSGDDLKPEHWDAMYGFYLDTGARKWGRPYLNRAFFEHIHENMRDQVLLVLAYQDDTPVAGALNFIGGDVLYGRYWGAKVHIPCLHFELCYYQAIEAGLRLGVSRVEAGAQGPHKLARGYAPTTTYSAHYLTHPGLHNAVADFLARERRLVKHEQSVLSTHLPFRRV